MRTPVLLALLVPLFCFGFASTGCSPSASNTDLGSGDAATLPQVGDVEVVAYLPARTEGIAFGKDPNGETVLYLGSADALWRVAADHTATKVADTPDPVGIAVRADGDVLVCGKGDVGGGKIERVIWRVTPAGAASILVRAPQGIEFGLLNFVAVAPDDRLVVSDSKANKLYLVEADGSAVTLITDQISYPNGIAFSADGKTLLVASWDTKTVYQLPRTANGYGAFTPYSTDIAYVDGIATLASNAQIYVTSAGVFHTSGDDHVAKLVAKGQGTLFANGAPGVGAFGENWLYLSNLLGGDFYRIYLGEPGAALPAR